ncbi:hypothetical protein PR048_019822 [Dryococelus australis]|uniref:Uncharacterized protein n=1 Tax=Dryococelus australis TaxID=614101 RepID=A0ABQ9H4T2_9NEOP|nr:hypothetical protein PR048_019822 [Dryococelus australis]
MRECLTYLPRLRSKEKLFFKNQQIPTTGRVQECQCSWKTIAAVISIALQGFPRAVAVSAADMAASLDVCVGRGHESNSGLQFTTFGSTWSCVTDKRGSSSGHDDINREHSSTTQLWSTTSGRTRRPPQARDISSNIINIHQSLD